MANTAALLGSLLNAKADSAYYTQQQIFWSNKYEANSAKLAKQVKYEEKWQNAFDEAIQNESTKHSGGVTVHAGNTDEMLADAYAHEKVKKYNEELSLELAEMDVDYDTMQSHYEALLQQVRANEQNLKTAVQSAAADPGTLQGG